MRFVLLVLLAACLCGCNRIDAQADNKILFAADGCAYYVRPGAGDTSFVRRIPDADKPTCKAPADE